MKPLLLSLVTVSLFALSAVAAAQPSLQPGLWEYNFDMESKSGQIEAAMQKAKKMLEALPPEQREMMEAQMAAHGVGMDLDTYTTKVCITPEQAERNEFPQPNENCTQTMTDQGNDTFKMEFSCEGNPPVSGEGELRLISDKEYRGKVEMDTSVNGQPETLIATQNGKWVADDCGSVKPVSN